MATSPRFRELYLRHTPRLRMVVMRLLGAARRSEVDDVVQETWLAACRGIHRYAGDAKFASWLTTIGIRTTYLRFARPGDAATRCQRLRGSRPDRRSTSSAR